MIWHSPRSRSPLFAALAALAALALASGGCGSSYDRHAESRAEANEPVMPPDAPAVIATGPPVEATSPSRQAEQIVAPAISRTPSTSESPSGEWIDLLRDIDPQRDTVAGKWSKSDAGLSVEAEPGSRLTLPWQAVREYDFEVEFTRHSGANSVAMLFVSGDGQASLDIDGWGQNLAGIQNIGGQSMRDNSSRVANVALENGRRYTASLHVRRDHVEALLDGKPLTTYQGDGADLSLLDLWRLPEKTLLGVAAWDSATTFHAIRVRPISNDRPASASLATNRASVDSRRPSAHAEPAVSPFKSPPVEPEPPPPASIPHPANDDITALSDEFDSPQSLSQWQRVFRIEQTNADQLQSIDIGKTKPGWLVLVPHTSTWYQDYRGVLAHKQVNGDFVVTTRVRVARRGGDGPPQSAFSLAGIMVRTPRTVTPQTWRPGQENYVFLSLGAARQPGRFAFEVKTTLDSRSNLEITETATPEAVIRVVRIGPDLMLLRKEPNRPWSVHRRYRRPDMPQTLQVGMTVYTDYPSASRIPPAEHNRQVIRGGNPDLVAGFDYFRFRRPPFPSELQGRSLSDPSQVSDTEILRLFGDAAD